MSSCVDVTEILLRVASIMFRCLTGFYLSHPPPLFERHLVMSKFLHSSILLAGYVTVVIPSLDETHVVVDETHVVDNDHSPLRIATGRRNKPVLVMKGDQLILFFFPSHWP